MAGATLLSNKLLAFSPAKERVVLQLYSVREAMKADPKGTLQKLAKAGYRNIEHANYIDRKFYGYTVPEFKAILNDLGLQMPSGHTVMTAQHWDNSKNDFTDVWKQTIEDAAAVGQRYVISPWLDESLRTDQEGLKKFMVQFNKCGELCHQHGLQFGYHNHNFEFSTMVGNQKLYDYILHETDPKLVAQQLDMGNMYGTGGIALDYIKKYPGRFELLHVKDEIKSAGRGDLGDGYESTILGEGIMPVKAVLAAARRSGTTQFVIEQESYQGKDTVTCVEKDLQIMKGWGYQ